MPEGLNLKIADIVFYILPTGTIKKFSLDKNYIPFKTGDEPEVVLKLGIDFESVPTRQIFTTDTWDYCQTDGRHIFNFSYSSKNNHPERRLVLDNDFKAGEIILGKTIRGRNGILRNREFKSAKSNEYMLIVSALQSTVNNQQSANLQLIVDFSKLLNIARYNNVSQMLYPLLKKHHDIPLDFMAELRRDYLSTAARNTIIYSEFKKAAEGFKDKGIDVIVMKGAALAELIYQDIGLRSMSDVDLLIRKEDILRVDEVLKNTGYKAIDLSPYDGIDITGNYLTTCDYRSENPLHPSFHVHWHIVNSTVPAPYSSRINMDELWKDALHVEIDGVRVLSMSPHHFLIHLCEHAMRATHSAAKLIYLLDVAALVSRYKDTLDWHKVVETSKDYSLDRFVYNILSLTRLNMGLDVPEWVLERLKPKRMALGERLFHFITARGKGFSGLSYLVHLSMNKGITKKISFIFRTLFPPAWVLAKRSSYEPDNQHAYKSAAILYLNRFGEILFHILSLLIHRFKKIGD